VPFGELDLRFRHRVPVRSRLSGDVLSDGRVGDGRSKKDLASDSSRCSVPAQVRSRSFLYADDVDERFFHDPKTGGTWS
jgi:hypothetical protein